MNKTIIVGNLVRDPESRQVNLNDGTTTTVCNFDVAVNMRYNGKESTEYFRVAAWRQLGDICKQYLSKGRKVLVEGTVSAQAYIRQDGTAAASMSIQATTVEFMGSPNGNDAQPAAQPANPAPARRPAAPQQPLPNYGVGQQPDPNNGFQPIETDELPF